MPDYKKMYLELFNAITGSIRILQDVQRKTEERYMQDGEDEKRETTD